MTTENFIFGIKINLKTHKPLIKEVANISGSVASVRAGYDFGQNRLTPDTLRHQICKIVERKLGRILTNNLSFLNHANIFNS